MNLNLLRGARCPTLVVAMTLAGYPGAAVAQESSAASAESPSLSVVYYPSSDLVSIDSHSTPLQRILNEISRPVFLTVKPLEPIPDRLVSVEIDKLSLEDAVRQLLGETPFTIAYVSGVDVIGAVLRHDSSEVSQTAAALDKIGSDAEKAWAIENLLVLATDQQASTRSAAVRALKTLAPEQAVIPLIDMLDADDTQVRRTAASELAALGDERAVDPLARAIDDPDPVVRDAAARSLAQLGGERAIRILLAVFSDGRTTLHETVAVALAFKGDDQAKMALAAVITEGRIAPEAVSNDVIQALVLSEEPGQR